MFTKEEKILLSRHTIFINELFDKYREIQRETYTMLDCMRNGAINVLFSFDTAQFYITPDPTTKNVKRLTRYPSVIKNIGTYEEIVHSCTRKYWIKHLEKVLKRVLKLSEMSIITIIKPKLLYICNKEKYTGLYKLIEQLENGTL